MSDHIPFEIQIEIMKRFPVKSLMRFRSVSKPWNSLIDSSRFISDYNLSQTQPHLFIMYEHPVEDGLKCVSIVDDDNFPEHQFDMSTILPDSVKQMFQPNKLMKPTLVGSSQGLLCFYGYSHVVIWNPWIRKSVDFSIPNVVFHRHGTVFGFGVCRETRDPKLVKIMFPEISLETETWKVEVFSFSSGYRTSRSFSKISNLLCKSFVLSPSNECIDGFIYWCASNKDNPFWVIISFDLTNEEFGVIYLPDSFARYKYLDLSKHRESLVLLPHDYNIAKDDYDVWMMDGGVTKSFKKLFTINSTYDCVKTMAFSYNGEAILEMLENYREENVASIDTYEPSSKRFKYIGITGIIGLISMSSCMETMLLHDY